MTLATRMATDLSRLVPALRTPVGSTLVSLKRREICSARFLDGRWVHRYRGGTTVSPTLGGASARLQDRITQDVFLHAYRPKPGDVVFDLGSGTGGEVRLLSRLAGSQGRVVAVEAHPRTYECLEATIRYNGLANVTPLQCAVTGERGVVHIEDDDHHIANGLTTDGARGVPVPADTLPGIAQRVGVNAIDLLKVNIEGAELPALEAATDLLPSVRNVAVSCHDFKADRGGADWQRTFGPVREILAGAGFTLTTRPDDPRPWVRLYLYGSR